MRMWNRKRVKRVHKKWVESIKVRDKSKRLKLEGKWLVSNDSGR